MSVSDFGARLKRARLSAGLTQEALADKCGMKKQSISRYERSDREPSIRTAKNLADALGVTLESLTPNKVQFASAEAEDFADLRELLQQMTPQEREIMYVQAEAIVQAHKNRDSHAKAE